jgi:hypothetical protein
MGMLACMSTTQEIDWLKAAAAAVLGAAHLVCLPVR